MDSRCVNPQDGLAHVLPTMQLGVLSPPSTFASGSTTPALSETCSISQELEEALAQVALDNVNVNEFSPSVDSEEQKFLDNTTKETTPYPNIFVIGDAADAFGAIPAGHTAYHQVRSSMFCSFSLSHSL